MRKIQSIFIFLLLFPLAFLLADSYINGKVVDSSSSNPMAGVKVQLLTEKKHLLSETETNGEGFFEFLDIIDGDYLVNVEFHYYVAVSANPLNVEVEGEPKRLNFSIALPGNIEGKVISSQTQNPIAHAKVEILRGSSVVMSTTTDKHGEYRIEGLPPRPFIARVTTPSFQSSMQMALPVSNETIRIDFNLLNPPGKICGQVIDRFTCHPVANTTVDIIHKGVIIDSAQSNEEGVFNFSEVPSGPYLMKAKALNYGVENKEVLVEVNETSKVNFVLDPYGVVYGVVIHQFSGNPIAGACVGMWQDGKVFAAVNTDENGKYSIAGLKDAHLVVQAPHFYDKEKGITIYPNEKTNADFVLKSMEPTPSRGITVVVTYKKFAHQINRINIIKWRESTDRTVVAYRLYRDGKIIAEIDVGQELLFKDRWMSGKEKKYEVTAVNAYGQESVPVRNKGFVEINE